MLERAIKNWIESKSYLPNNVSEAYSLFIDETKIVVSECHFYRVFPKYSKAQVIKTGGVYTGSKELIDMIVDRSFYGVNMYNSFSIDEKPIIVNNYKSKKVRVALSHKGKIPSNQIVSYKSLDKLKNIYLICCISCNGIIQYHLSEVPINTQKFNAFIQKLCSILPKQNEGRFLLIDNASFHGIDESTIECMQEKKLAFTRTPPLGCLFNPIEEFFAYFDQILKRKIKMYLKQNKEPIDQDTFVQLIHSSLKDSINMNIKQIFRRAGILEE